MKKLLVALSILLLSALIPLNASACGGFVALRGEQIFHSVYCDEILGVEYNSLIWFNAASDAEVWGYSMCEKCADWHDNDFHSDYCDYYFETNDPLLLTAMELSIECGYEGGREHEREEHSNYYDQGYEDGYEEGRYRGRIEGIEESESSYAAQKEEIRENRQGAIGTIGFCVAIAFIINWFDRRKKK